MLQEIKLLIKDLNLKKPYLNDFPDLMKDGVQVFKGFLKEDELKRHKSDFDSLMSDEKIPKVEVSSDKRIYGVERYNDLFITEKQKIFISDFNNNVKYLPDNVHFTLAGEISSDSGNLGSGGGWHRDSPYTNQFKTIIYLTDVGENNGPFQYIRGSHKKSGYKLINKVLKEYDYGKNRFSEDEILSIVNNINGFNNSTITGKSGDLILVNTRGLHRGAPLTEGTRKAVTTYSFRNKIPNKFYKI